MAWSFTVQTVPALLPSGMRVACVRVVLAHLDSRRCGRLGPVWRRDEPPAVHGHECRARRPCRHGAPMPMPKEDALGVLLAHGNSKPAAAESLVTHGAPSVESCSAGGRRASCRVSPEPGARDRRRSSPWCARVAQGSSPCSCSSAGGVDTHAFVKAYEDLWGHHMDLDLLICIFKESDIASRGQEEANQ